MVLTNLATHRLCQNLNNISLNKKNDKNYVNSFLETKPIVFKHVCLKYYNVKKKNVKVEKKVTT